MDGVGSAHGGVHSASSKACCQISSEPNQLTVMVRKCRLDRSLCTRRDGMMSG